MSKVRCARCRQLISDKSAFAVKIQKVSGHVLHDIVCQKFLLEGDIAIHVNGDRECGKEVSSYKPDLLEALGFTSHYDLAFLDFL